MGKTLQICDNHFDTSILATKSHTFLKCAYTLVCTLAVSYISRGDNSVPYTICPYYRTNATIFNTVHYISYIYWGQRVYPYTIFPLYNTGVMLQY